MDLLVVAGIGAEGGSADWAIWVGAEPGEPANCITIYEAGGQEPVGFLDHRRPVEQPSIQVRVRGVSYVTTRAKMQTVIDVLRQIASFTVGTWEIKTILQTTGVTGLPRDKSNRYPFTTNFRMLRQATS